MDFVTRDFSLDLSHFTESADLILKEVHKVFKYAENKRTDVLLGYVYTVVDSRTYDRFDVKVLKNEPLITAEQLAQQADPVVVAFKDAVVVPYKIDYGKVKATITAAEISFGDDVLL